MSNHTNNNNCSKDGGAAVFGNSSSDDEEEEETARGSDGGVLTFHNGTEQALGCYVMQQVPSIPTTTSNGVADEEDLESQQQLQQQQCRRILEAIDTFCYQRHWMMHVGPIKGRILQDFLTQRLVALQQQPQQHFQKKIVVVELGTYCGYSLLTMAERLLLNQTTTTSNTKSDHAQRGPSNFAIISVDVNPQTQTVARRLIALAGLSDYVTLVVRDTTSRTPGPYCENDMSHDITTRLSDQLKAAIRKQQPQRGWIPNTDTTTTTDDSIRIDFLLLDHAKECYLSDLQQLERTGLLQAGTAVVADNVVFFQLDEYRSYVQQQQRHNHTVTTQLVPVALEYSEGSGETHINSNNNDPSDTVAFQDGMGTYRTTVHPKERSRMDTCSSCACGGH